MEPRLSARGITQHFGERAVLEDVDLEVPAGRVVGLLGPNGAGKTTLMRILFGVLAPEAGTLTWKDRPVTDDDRRRWGYMPQERGLYRDMRVLDLLVWIARLHGLDRAEGQRRACELLGQLDLAERERDKISTLSGGMAQRVQLAAAMVHGPDLLVLDEPFAGLDPVAVRFLSDVITAHTRAGRNLLFSSHQLDLVEDLCETITLLHHGRVVLHGDLRELKAESPNRWLRVDVPVDPGVGGPLDRGDGLDRRSRHPPPPGAPCRSRRGPRRHPPARSCRRLRRRSPEPVGALPRGRRGGSRMTWFEATRLVAARELRESFRRRSLWIVLAILFVGSSVAMILPEVLDGGSTRDDVAVVPGADTGASSAFRSDLGAAAATLDAEVRFHTVSDRSRRPHARRPGQGGHRCGRSGPADRDRARG